MKWLALCLLVSMPALADIAKPPPEAAQAAPQHPGGNENAPGMQDMGVVKGGWGYVYAAWGAGVFGILLYGVSLFVRKADAPPPGAP